MQKIYYFLIFFFAVTLGALAQETVYTIKGTVSDNTDVLIGVTVTVQGKMGGAVTDVNGDFSIRASKGDKLIFSYIGYETLEYLVTKEESDLKITLKTADTQIDEVIVTAMGTQRKISSLASISSVTPEELQVPTPSVANLLGGRVAGVITMVNSGEPGKNLAEFWVRGIGTFGANSSALVLIDGLEGNINSIDPADIESFSVLKDASATAVYGVRGANGVVLITTKRGETNKLSLTARVNYSISQIRRLPKYLRAYDYALLVNEAKEVRGEDPTYNDIQLNVIRDGLDPDLYPDVSWQDEMIHNLSLKQNYYVSARGGGNVARYFVSLAGSNESAAYKVEKNNPYASNTGYNTYSLRLNLDINLTKNTSLYFGSEGFISVNNRPGQVNTDFIWQSQASLTPLIFPVHFSNGQLPAAGTDSGMSPYVLINHTGKTSINHNSSMFTIALNQDLGHITEGLRIKAQGAYNRNGDFTEMRFTFPALYRAIGRNSKGELLTREQVARSASDIYGSSQAQWRKFHFESTLNYDRVFNDDHRVGGLVYYYLSDQQATNQMTYDESANLRASLAQIPKRYMGLSSRLTYGFKDTYLLDLNFGYTGSENFIPGKQFGFFPSIALGWVPTGYKFMQDNYPWINLIKFRGTYGTVGNDRIGGDRFPYLNRVSEGYANVWGASTSVERVGISRVGADNLIWEVAKKANLGIDLAFLNSKLTGTVDIFKDRRDGIFQPRVQVPDFVGLPNMPYGNVGKMESWGTDGNAAYTHIINNDMDFTVRGNYTFAQNKILNYEKTYDEYPYQDYTGLPDNVWRGLQCLGFFKNEDDIKYSPKQSWGEVKPGDLKYKDINGDGKVDDNDKVPISYKEMYPQLMYGFGGQFRYKDITVGVLFRGTGKVDYYRNNTGYIPFNEGERGNVLVQFNDPSTRWIPKAYVEAHGMDPSLAENPNAQLPRLQYGNNSNNTQLSDFWKGDARYLRLQEVTINYNLRNNFLKQIGIGSLDLQLVGNNLYIWDKVKIFDPEQAHKVGRVYPIPAIYSFQMYVNF
ncbi:TonB-dependent receptor [Proteiniphilum sp.]|uniref:SusC/RagA family TonB-linked outer membrane protein n=1 Tax=Proteiniphilum sp. TaxID=1926877 RepID=UPI002B1EB50A|nr:TonB-dependent receptor [Proteiniphilum sp.]MEA4918199.1 TonB-dependent receptor [Proteiniphilum sp.]